MISRLIAAAAVLAATAVPLVPVADAPMASAVSCTVAVRLSPGVNNAAVRCLEQRLQELGYRSIVVDNVYDAVSAGAVRDFQRKRGLYPDGLITSITGRQLGLRGALPPTGSPKVTVLGDSTSAAMRWYDEARNETAIYDVMGASYDLQWSVESCRRLMAPSCVGRTDPGTGLRWVPVSVLPEMRTNLKGRLGQAVVIMAGYDDYPSISDDIDAIMGEAEAQGVSRVIWLNYRTSSSYGYGAYYANHNATLQAAKVRHPNLVVLDWNRFTRSQPIATQRAWFAADDIHMTREGALALARYLKTSIDASDVTECTAINTRAGTAPPAVGVPSSPPLSQEGLTAARPARVFDSAALAQGKVAAGRMVMVDLTASVTDPSATSAVLGVTALNPCQSGYLTVWDCGVRPGTSNINFKSNRTTNGVVISLMSSRRVCIFTSSAVDVRVDLTGWFAPGGALFHPSGPTRWLDTRTQFGALLPTKGVLTAGAQINVPVASRAGIPATATAVWINMTAVSAGGAATLLVYPGPCATPPTASTVTVHAGRAAASSALVALGADGSVCVRSNAGTANAVIDVAGWFHDESIAGGLAYRATAPTRIQQRVAVSAGGTKAVPLAAVSVLNVVAATPAAPGHLTVRPCGTTATSSLVNYAARENSANLGVIAPGSGGAGCITTSATTAVLADLTGVFIVPIV
jgi:hypothetical protein